MPLEKTTSSNLYSCTKSKKKGVCAMYILKRKTEYSAYKIVLLALVTVCGAFLLWLWYTLTFPPVLPGGRVAGVSANVSIALLVIGILLLAGGGFFLVHHLSRRKKQRVTIDGNMLHIQSKAGRYTLDVTEAEHLHLLSAPKAGRYGFYDTLAFLKSNEWTVLGPYYQSSADLYTIYGELLERYRGAKITFLNNRMNHGKAAYFPYLAQPNDDGRSDLNVQNAFDAKLCSEGDAAKLPVKMPIPTIANIELTNDSITVGGRTIPFEYIHGVHYRKYSGDRDGTETLNWQKGRHMFLLNSSGQSLLGIALPSVLDGDLLAQLLYERIHQK